MSVYCVGVHSCKEGAQKRVRFLPFSGQTGQNHALGMAYGQSAGPRLQYEPSLGSLRGLGAKKRVL